MLHILLIPWRKKRKKLWRFWSKLANSLHGQQTQHGLRQLWMRNKRDGWKLHAYKIDAGKFFIVFHLSCISIVFSMHSLVGKFSCTHIFPLMTFLFTTQHKENILCGFLIKYFLFIWKNWRSMSETRSPSRALCSSPCHFNVVSLQKFSPFSFPRGKILCISGLSLSVRQGCLSRVCLTGKLNKRPAVSAQENQFPLHGGRPPRPGSD